MGEILLKGNGVLVHGPHASERNGQLLALSPGEMEERFGNGDGTLSENPFHIDPATRMRLRQEDGFQLRNVYESLVEGMYKHLVNKLGHLDPNETKRQLRKYVNQSAELFNQANLKQGNTKNLYPHFRGKYGWGGYHDGSATIFPDENSNAVHPELQKSLNAYTPEFQKVNSLHPHQVKLKNKKGQYVTLNHSMNDHKQWGHMSEGGFFGAIMQYLSLVADHWNVEAPHGFKNGYIKPEELVIHTDPMTTKESSFWKYWGANEDPNSGHHHLPEENRQHPPISLRSALCSLHPAFFQPAIRPEKITSAREDYARFLLSRGGERRVREEDVGRFSRSMLMQILEDSRAGNNALRSASHTFHWYNQLREAAGLPKWNAGAVGRGQLPHGLSLEQQQLIQRFNHNRNHLVIGNYMNPNDRRTPHNAANKMLRSGLLLSMWLDQTPNNMEDRAKVMPNADGRGLQTGAELREIFRRSHNDAAPVTYHDYLGPDGQWLSAENTPPSGSNNARIATGEWPRTSILPRMGDVASVASRLVPRSPSEKTVQNPTIGGTDVEEPQGDYLRWSDDTLYDLMESLQSADARMDDYIIKSLPAPRRHNIADDGDLMALCNHYQLSKSDIYYIQQSVGDWESIAERLKVDPHVVKSVKVALRW